MKKSQTRYAQTVPFFHTTQRFVPWVLLQILSSDTEPDISNMSDSQLKHICDSLYHIVNIKVLAGGEVFDLFEGVHRPAVREKEKNWDFL